MAAICGATLELANRGLLDTRKHTSNAPFFLTGTAPQYKGAANYQENPAVSGGNVITVSSAGALLWARYILETLQLFSPETIHACTATFSTGDANYFVDMMGTLRK